MSETDTADASRGRRTRWIAVGAVTLIVLLVAWVLVPPSDAPLLEKIAELRAAGFAMSFAEAAQPEPPAGENGWDEFAAAVDEAGTAVGARQDANAFGPWDSAWTDDEKNPWWTGYPPERLEKLRVYTEKLRPFLTRVEAALAKPVLSPPVKRHADGFPDGSHIRALQTAQKDLSVIAYGAASADDRLRAVLAQLELARRTRCVGTIDHMVANAIAAGGRESLRVGLTDGAFAAAPIRGRVDATLPFAWRSALRASLASELVFSGEFCPRVLRGEVPTWIGKPPTARQQWEARWERLVRRARGGSKQQPDFTAADHALVLDIMRAFHDTEAATYVEYMRAVGPSKARLAAARLDENALFVAQAVADRFVRGEAEAGLARIAVAVKAHRETTGAWPASLDDVRAMFPGGLPVEPYRGEPYAYEVGARAVRIALPEDAIVGWRKPQDPIKAWEFPK